MLAVIAIPLVVRLTHSGEALPGTTVAGTDVGGLDADALRARLRAIAAPGRAVVVLAGDERLTVRPAEAGDVVDLDATVRRALDAGRDGALGGLPATYGGLFAERDVELVAEVERVPLRRTVETLARRVDEPSFPGALQIPDDGLSVTAEPPRAGRVLDREQLKKAPADGAAGAFRRTGAGRGARGACRLRRGGRGGRDGGRRLPRLAADAARHRQTGHGRAGRAGERARAWGRADGGREVRLGVDGEALAATVTRVAEERDRPRADARVAAGASGVVVDGKEDLTWRPRAADGVSIEPARAGRTVDQRRLAAAIARAVRAGTHNVRVPTRRVEPAVTDETGARRRPADRHVHDLLRAGPAARDEHPDDGAGRRRSRRRAGRAVLAQRPRRRAHAREGLPAGAVHRQRQTRCRRSAAASRSSPRRCTTPPTSPASSSTPASRTACPSTAIRRPRGDA